MSKPTADKPEPKSPARIGRYITRREALNAASRHYTSPDGKRFVIRFTLGQRMEHFILTLSFTMLAITGLAQSYYGSFLGNWILNFFGGIESTRLVHHVFAFVFAAQSIYHAGLFVYEFVVYRQVSKIWPDGNDIRDFIQMMKLNLGLSRSHPRFDRYTFEEKAEYWALVWGTIIMGVTGLMQWFPVLVTELLPGWSVTVARALHRWEAVLAVLAILTWHFYHSVLKKLNTSIFSGLMSIEDMEEEHPLELLYLERAAAAAAHNQVWPYFVDLTVEAEDPGDGEQNASDELPQPSGAISELSTSRGDQ